MTELFQIRYVRFNGTEGFTRERLTREQAEKAVRTRVNNQRFHVENMRDKLVEVVAWSA